MRTIMLACAAVVCAACSSAERADTAAGDSGATSNQPRSAEAASIPLEPARPITSKDQTSPAVRPVEKRSAPPPARPVVEERSFSKLSPQGAADVVQRYFALLSEQMFTDAWNLWTPGAVAAPKGPNVLAREVKAYGTFFAQVAAPGQMEVTGGHAYVSVPVTLTTSTQKSRNGRAQKLEFVLRRSIGVSDTPDDLQTWHIWKVNRRPAAKPTK